jgi:hypothetical protein
MADEHLERAYRASQPPVRSAPGAQASAPGTDPLVELARLIGQNDPFGEYGHNGRGAAAQAEPSNYAPMQAHDLHASQTYGGDRYAAPDARYAAPPVQSAPFAPPPAPPPSHYAQQGYADTDYAQESYGSGLVPGQDESAGFDRPPYFPNAVHPGAEDEHYYDDVPPRRRVGILAIAAVFALVVVGTAGAFGYRTLFGSSGAKTAPPPVIKADATPSKVVPAVQSKDPQTGKLIYDRVNNQNEKVVSREEQPVDIKERPVGSVTAPGAGAAQGSVGTGVIGGVEPKKIHTIAIHPNQQPGAAPEAAIEQAPPPAAVRPPPVAQPAAPRVTAETPAARPAPPPPEPKVARAAAPPPAPSPASNNAPLSLDPHAAAPAAQPRAARTASAPAQIAPAARAAAPMEAKPAAGGSGYAVQIVARHNEADAQTSFQSLQSKFPQQLGGRSPLIRRVDLGAKGVYYRALVGPFGNADEASQLCSSLKAAGGECIVQKI